MTLRARVALALALLAAAAVIAVSVTSYVVTGNSVRAETDRALRSYGQQLQDPDGRAAARVCTQFAPYRDPDHDHEPDPGALVSLPGAQVQCLDASGSIRLTSIEYGLPVTTADEAVARHAESSHVATVSGRDGHGRYRVYTVAVHPTGAVQIAQSTEAETRALDTVRDRALVVGAVVIACAAAAGWFLARRAARPLSELTAAAEHIAATGRPQESGIRVAGNDEVARLGAAFTTMLAALTRARDEQQRLAQDASHELRTPLTSLRTNIETLQRHPDLAPDVRARVVDDLSREEGELQALVEELVALVSDEERAEPTEVIDLGPLIAHQAERARARHGRDVHVTVDATRVEGQPRRLERVVANLLDNAVKFSDPPAPVEVTLREGVLTVRDHGPGFTARDLPHVFERFYRADAARSRPGSGLGLSIVDEIVRAHGGRVDAANASDGGAVVTVTLPTA